MLKSRSLIILLVTTVMSVTVLVACDPKTAAKTLTIIHMGDIHGHMVPRPNLRSDGKTGVSEGGLAYMFTQIERIRDRVRRTNSKSILINTGDTIQGSAEALYTRGQALVNVLNKFDINFFAPGNWEFVYGTQRFIELFAGPTAIAPWNALAANLYYDGAPYAAQTNARVLEPYKIINIDGITIGILGFTTERGPKVIGAEVVQGFRFTKGDDEMTEFVTALRPQVDVLLVISELGLANNIRLAEANPGVDIILSSDMHEITFDPVVTSTGTMIIEEGQDGTRLGELRLSFDSNNKIIKKEFEMWTINQNLVENPTIAAAVAAERAPFVTPTFQPGVIQNPINNTVLNTAIDTVIGQTDVGLHRSNFSGENMPAVIEGSSHNFLADVFREMSGADIGVIRGFRYGTHIAPGPIKLEDIYHYIAIGPFIASGEVSGQLIKNIIENSSHGSLAPNPFDWGGGWLFGWSGIKFDLDPYQPLGSKASNIVVWNAATNSYDPLVLTATYKLGGYNYDSEPGLINKAPAANVVQVKDPSNTTQSLDGTMVVAEYLKIRNANPEANRIRLLNSLPLPRYKNLEVQPLGQM